jgi:hypothetical protein
MIGFNIRNHRHVVLAIGLVTTFLTVSCAAISENIYHGYYMKGSIIETYDSEVYLCIGRKDGAAVGQELDVKRYWYSRNPKTGQKGKGGYEYTGKVRIVEVLDEHFAKAVVISGKAEKNSIVELGP